MTARVTGAQGSTGSGYCAPGWRGRRRAARSGRRVPAVSRSLPAGGRCSAGLPAGRLGLGERGLRWPQEALSAILRGWTVALPLSGTSTPGPCPSGPPIAPLPGGLQPPTRPTPAATFEALAATRRGPETRMDKGLSGFHGVNAEGLCNSNHPPEFDSVPVMGIVLSVSRKSGPPDPGRGPTDGHPHRPGWACSPAANHGVTGAEPSL